VGDESTGAIVASVIGNVAIGVAKFTAAAFTGSSAMISEGIHSLVDTGDGLLLLMGVRRSRRPPDEAHPFGHGKEVYFWSLIVAISIFGIGGGMSVYEGIRHLLHPAPLVDPFWNYLTLAISAAAEAASLFVAMRAFRGTKGTRGWWRGIREAKDPTTFTVVFENAAALIGLTFATVGISLTAATGSPLYDGLASIAIGLLLASAAVVLAGESRGLLLGEAADPETAVDVKRVAEADPSVRSVARVLTLQMGPATVLLDVEVDFDPTLTVEQIHDAALRMEHRIREKHPEVSHVFIEVESLEPHVH